MFDKIPPDFYGWVGFVISGSVGAMIRHLNSGAGRIKIIIEMIAGAVCAAYCSELIAHILFHALIKFDLVEPQKYPPEKLMAFAGFLCGMCGIQLLNAAIEKLKKMVS